MKLRSVMLLVLSGSILAFAAFAFQNTKTQKLLVLTWAEKAKSETPPVAVLIELGRKDIQATPWPGKATVKGAKVVSREGYCFRENDKLIEPDAWEGSTRKLAGLGKSGPAINAMEGVAGFGVVLHLADVQKEAALTLTAGKEQTPATVPLSEVMKGKPVPIWDGAATVRLISTATPVASSKTQDDFPAAAYGPDGTLWAAFISYTLHDESRLVESKSLPEQPKEFGSYYTPEFGDQLWVKAYRDGKWSAPIAITEPQQDLVGCAIAVETDGTVWGVYSAHRDGKHELKARPITGGASAAKVGTEERIGGGDARQIHPAACTDQDGSVRVACQSRTTDGSSVISSWKRTGGQWAAGTPSAAPGRSWFPAVAAGPNGEAATTYDCYRDGDYDVFLTTSSKADVGIVTSSQYEARPAAAYDPQGRLWIAYELGPDQWGKNFGELDDRGNPLYFTRAVKVVCVQDGKLFRPVAELPPLTPRPVKKHDGSPEINLFHQVEKLPHYSHPQLGLDGKGRLWLTYIQKFGNRYTSKLGSHWITFARRLDGDHWSEPVEIHHSDGMMDPRRVLLPHPAGGLRVLASGDGRFTSPTDIGNKVYMSYVDLPGDAVEPKLVPHEPGAKDEKFVAAQKAELDAVRTIRNHRVEAAGKTYQPLRGEFHRHTEISWDGGPDGSINDMFRYGIDAAEMDWIGNGDHDNGGGREYSWWIIQKLTDAYHTGEHFTPMFSYERSVSYPHGHRNCVFAKRGVRTLPRLAQPNKEEAVAGIHADDAKMCYRYLRALDGICASHTSATGMGTDWRDNDPVAEPLVEIYQGDRNSYEMQGAPRAGFDPKSGKKPAQVAGWFPAGFIDLALGQKGYRLGFQSSSDHFSTHISYCIVLAEKYDRPGILDAMKKRHCYGATDNIVLDVRCGDHIMGEEFKSVVAPKIDINAIGTGPIKEVVILKDSKVVQTMTPGRKEFRESWTDSTPSEGMHYYYVRVMQEDGELAWASPMWVHYAK